MMVVESLTVILILAALTAGFTMLGRCVIVPQPVLLALIGIALSFVRVFPTIQLDPEVVLLVMLPPLVYSAAVEMPWEDFRSNARSISLFALGLVALTSACVAVVAHIMVRGLSWPEALALGAIVSPTDPVASTAVSDRLGLPRRLVSITKGEGLVNDAIALTLLKIATAAILAHSFSIAGGLMRFGAIVIGETAYGTAVGWVTSKLRKRISDGRVDVTVSLLTPFLAYLVPQSLGGSGVLATVAAGMYVGIQTPELVSSETRLDLASVWDVLTFILEGSLFLLTGLQFRSVIDGTLKFTGASVLLYGLAITATVIVLRFLWTLAVTGLGSRFWPGKNEPSFPKRHLIYLGWCGMRGGISLAAALSLAIAIPSRGLIIFITACVIAGTLILQGGPLPFLLRALKLDEDAKDEREASKGLERKARIESIDAALKDLEECGEEAASIRDEYRRRLELLRRGSNEEADIGPAGYARNRVHIRLEALRAERGKILSLRREGKLPEYVSHRIERDLDLREVRLQQLFPANY